MAKTGGGLLHMQHISELAVLELDQERAWRETGSRLVERRQNFNVPPCPECGQAWPWPGSGISHHAGATQSRPMCETCLQPAG